MNKIFNKITRLAVMALMLFTILMFSACGSAPVEDDHAADNGVVIVTTESTQSTEIVSITVEEETEENKEEIIDKNTEEDSKENTDKDTEEDSKENVDKETEDNSKENTGKNTQENTGNQEQDSVDKSDNDSDIVDQDDATTPEKPDDSDSSDSNNNSQSSSNSTSKEELEKTDETEYRFKNKYRLEEHYEKHGMEMGFDSAEDYEEAASAVVNNPEALHKTEKEDGDDVYYIEATNEFVIVSPDGYIRTYFWPSAGIDYYNRQ